MPPLILVFFIDDVKLEVFCVEKFFSESKSFVMHYFLIKLVVRLCENFLEALLRVVNSSKNIFDVLLIAVDVGVVY